MTTTRGPVYFEHCADDHRPLDHWCTPQVCKHTPPVYCDHGIEVKVDGHRVLVRHGHLTVLGFEHPNPEGAARELARLLEVASRG